MAPLELEGTSLGEKHRHYNKLVKEAIANNKPIEPGDLNSGENEIEHLMKIDIASNNKDVEYILKVLKCEDMLYVSRAIKQSTWLFSDNQYAHIINPTYLNAHIFPEMSEKAKTKFMKHLRLKLKDEARAEQFFEYEKESSIIRALKWLPNCSEKFIISKALTYLIQSRNVRLFKRICEKMSKVSRNVRLFKFICKKTVLESLLDQQHSKNSEKLESVNFLLHVDPEAYLKVVEGQETYSFGIRTTKFLMQICPDRIIDNFEKYCEIIHIPTFIKHLKDKNIKDFLIKQFKKKDETLEHFFWDPSNFKVFIDAMSEKERSLFLDQVFIKKVHTQADVKEDSEKYAMRKIYNAVTSRIDEYLFYDFKTAFDIVTKSIRTVTSQNDKNILLERLLTCTSGDMTKITTVLKYYYQKHINDPLESKKVFMKNLLPLINIPKINSECWHILEDLFKRMDVYDVKNEIEFSGCIQIIVLYNIIRGGKIPETVENLYNTKLLKKDIDLLSSPKIKISRGIYEIESDNNFDLYLKSMNDQDKENVFKYLYDSITRKILNETIKDETDFKEAIAHLISVLTVLSFWKKELSDYPWILKKIKEYLEIKKQNSWKTNMASIYNKKKCWKKLMFDESIELCPSEVVCINILKHNVQLLSLERDEVNVLRCKDGVSLRRLLSKLRVYWPQSLRAEWTQRYLAGLSQPQGHKAVVRGLCTLLPQKELLQIIHNYAPKQAKIEYKEADEIMINVQKQLAKNMHIARPQPPPTAILLYVKGDYLQYAVPSLLAIFHNANKTQTKNFITTLLFSPVSVQKHGIRLAFARLGSEEALPVFRNIWMNTTNPTIRAVVFQYTFSLLNKNKNLVNDILDTLFCFIDNLSHEEDKTIYEIISRENTFNILPDHLKAKFLLKTYDFLMGFIPKLTEHEKGHYEWRVSKMIECTTNFMEQVSTDFMIKVLTQRVEKYILREEAFNHSSDRLPVVVSTFLLCTNADKTQNERYIQFMIPLLQRCISSWGEPAIKRNVDSLLDQLRCSLKSYVFAKNIDIPLYIFEDIERILNELPVPDNYIFLTKWKLTVELTKLLTTKGSAENWDKTCTQVAPLFGSKCLEHLKNDVTLYFPCIYTLFSTALNDMSNNILPISVKLIIYRHLLEDSQFVQAYLAVIKLYPRYEMKKTKEAKELRKILGEHPSVEVKMHFNHRFRVKAKKSFQKLNTYIHNMNCCIVD